MSKKNLLLVIVVLFLIVGFLLLRTKNTNTPSNQPDNFEKITVGIQTSPAMALVMVAEEKEFDKQYGIDMQIKEFTAGKFALQSFLGGSLDIAISGDVPVTLSTLQGNEFLVAGQVVAKTINETRVVAQKEDEYTSAKEYFKAKKRKLATSFGGGPEFFTYEFLNHIDIVPDQIEILSQKPEDMPAALINGTVDAISIFDPFAFIAEKEMGDKAVTFTNANVYSELYVIDVQTSIKDNPEPLEKFLRALIDAEKFTQENPEQAKNIVMQYTKLDKETVDGIWESFDFRVALTKDLLEFWHRQAQWAKATGKVTQNTQVPDFKNIIFSEPLRKIAPSAVEF